MSGNDVCVLGLGYIGLPTSAVFASNGFNVVGVDVNPNVVATLNDGRIHIEEPGLGDIVHQVVNEGKFKAQLAPVEADAYILAVPTPNDANNAPVLDFVRDAARSIVPFLRSGCLVILESTSPPGATMSLIPILEESGLKVGDDILLAHSPERVLPGRILAELIENDRVIGGVTPRAAETAAALYGTFVTGEIHLTDATTAEMAKLMENTFRDVNIALANEFSRIGQTVGIDIHEAIKLANYHPRVNILNPGPGVGGHCIAVDPWFIVDAAPEVSHLIQTARKINDAQPDYVVEIVETVTQDLESPKIALLGLAYKPDVDDLRESPSVEVMKRLIARGYQLNVHDSHVRREVEGIAVESDLAKALTGADMMLILTDHSEYRDLDPDSSVLTGLARKIVVDTRSCLDHADWTRAGYKLVRLGDGRTTEA